MIRWIVGETIAWFGKWTLLFALHLYILAAMISDRKSYREAEKMVAKCMMNLDLK